MSLLHNGAYMQNRFAKTFISGYCLPIRRQNGGLAEHGEALIAF